MIVIGLRHSIASHVRGGRYRVHAESPGSGGGSRRRTPAGGRAVGGREVIRGAAAGAVRTDAGVSTGDGGEGGVAGGVERD